MISWHRLFGIALADLFADTAWEVVVELDLSLKLQLLDIVIVRRGQGTKPPFLPDGFGPLSDHNLVTYKSLREPLDGWSLKELVGHYVNYRKQISPSLDRLLPEKSFRLFAISTRNPKKLAREVKLHRVGAGIYDVPWGTDVIRLLVLSEIPASDHNALLNLFSGDKSRVSYAADRLRSRHSEASTLLQQLFEHYQVEGLIMPYTKQDFLRDVAREQVKELSLKELFDIRGVDCLSAEELLAALPEETRQSLEKALQRSTTESKQKPQSPRKLRVSRQNSK